MGSGIGVRMQKREKEPSCLSNDSRKVADISENDQGGGETMEFLTFLIEWATILGACAVVTLTVGGIVYIVKYLKT